MRAPNAWRPIFAARHSAVQSTFSHFSVDERLPGGPAVRASPHLISYFAFACASVVLFAFTPSGLHVVFLLPFSWAPRVKSGLFF